MDKDPSCSHEKTPVKIHNNDHVANSSTQISKQKEPRYLEDKFSPSPASCDGIQTRPGTGLSAPDEITPQF